MRNNPNPAHRLRNPAWLLQGLFNSLPGVIRLQDGIISFSAHGSGTFSRKRLMALEQQTRQPGLADKLDKGGQAKVLQVPMNRIERVHFPWYYFQGGMVIDADGCRYRFSFTEPQNAKMPSSFDDDLPRDLSAARKAGKRWREALETMTAHPDRSRTGD